MSTATPFSRLKRALPFFPVVLALALFQSACTWKKISEDGFNRTLMTADAKRGVALRMADYTSFPWERVYIFPPGTDSDEITKNVDYAMPFPHNKTGGYCLVVFVNHGEIAADFEVDMKVADLSKLYRRGGYLPAEAIFTFENHQFYQWQNNRG